jgi:uncharacterized protein
MTLPEKRITEFIGEHHIFTIAIARENKPWCATCYYAYLEDLNWFIFTSDPGTRHIRDMLDGNNLRAAGAIALETRITGKIRGLQFSGKVTELKDEALKKAKSAYLKRFPVALLLPGLHLWSLEPEYIKMTDNRLGIGKKLIWSLEKNGK